MKNTAPPLRLCHPQREIESNCERNSSNNRGRIFLQWSRTTRCGAGEASGLDRTRKVVEILGTRCEGSYSNPKLPGTQESSKLQRSVRWRRKDAQGADNVEEEKQREMDEGKRGKKSLRLSDAQITMQIPTDRRRGRDRGEERESA